MSKLPSVRMTTMLRDALLAENWTAAEIQELCDKFARWKRGWPVNEYTFWFFGKDGEYDRPKRNGKNVLRHVHLPPEIDLDELDQWDVDYARRTEKTSDTALIYAQDPRHGFLLITIVNEPRAHDFAEMLTADDAELMNELADQADAFIFNGSVYL